MNALRFKGKWKEPFDPKGTAEAPFVGVDGKALPAMLMRLPEAERAFRAEKGFIGVDLPFAGDRYSLTIVTSTDQPRALKEFAPVKSWLSGAGFAPRRGDLALPRFSLETQSDLMPSLRSALEDGLKSPTAFSGFGAGAKIDGILQRAKIEVDEQGATAAAATAVFVARALAVDDALHMVVDKPYLFALRDRQSGFILIAGYVAKAPGSSPPQTDSPVPRAAGAIGRRLAISATSEPASARRGLCARPVGVQNGASIQSIAESARRGGLSTVCC